MKAISNEDYIIRAKQIHGDTYDYSVTDYKTKNAKINILCNIHGVFCIWPANHIQQKSGCPMCKNRNRTDISNIRPEHNVEIIPLKDGKYTKIDLEDAERVKNHSWVLVSGYVRSPAIGALHRFILGLKNKRLQVDHINHDPLDNRKINLRVCTKDQNNHNSRKRCDNTSGFKGVIYQSKAWVSRINYNKKSHYLGRFNTKEEAAVAYDKKAKELFGEFAFLNFPL